jgi:hypothetical protein
MNDDDLPPFQWIFHFECFHFLNKILIKEFCGYCIQTGESILYHVRTPANFLLEMDSVHVGVFAPQSLRHGFSLSDGDISLEEFYKKVNQKVAKDCTIFTSCRIVEKFFSRASKYSYPDVIYLGKYLPYNYKRVMMPLPDKACNKKHSSVHCAQRIVHELAKFLKPSFVPYLQCSLIQKQCANYTAADNEQVKYGQQYLKPPFYQSLKPVDLVRDAINQESKESQGAAVPIIENCEYSMEG